MVKYAPMKNEELCPCSSGKTFGECCGPVLSGEKKAETAAQLMRARYSAYAVCDTDFLFKSSGEEVRKEFDAEASEKWSKQAEWNGLEIVREERGGKDDEDGVVEFVAHYKAGGRDCEHHERSVFRRIDGEWRFIDGVIRGTDTYRRETPKVGRNDPCPCGSGKKYKKCCGRGAE